jgi:hypothetical protein
MTLMEYFEKKARLRWAQRDKERERERENKTGSPRRVLLTQSENVPSES